MSDKVPLSRTNERVDLYDLLTSSGTPKRDAAIATFPELNPDTATAQVSAIPRAGYVDQSATSPTAVSKSLLESDTRLNLVLKGMSPQGADTIAQGAAAFVPESTGVVEYQKLGEKLRQLADRNATDPVELTLANSQTVRDIQLAGAAMYGATGGMQQGLFSYLIGERAATVAERLWPHANIREDDGTMKSKAVIPMSLRIMALGSGGLVQTFFDTMRFGAVGPANKLTMEARNQAQKLVDSDYQDNLLTGQEVAEYWMAGAHPDISLGEFSAWPSMVPDPGTPERAAYDKQVSDEVAQNLATLHDKRFGDMAMAGIATSGALADVFADPALIVSELPVKMVEGARALLPASSRARVTGAIADRTGRLEHFVTAFKDAEAWANDAAEIYRKTPTAENKTRLTHATKMRERYRAQIQLHESPGFNEAFLMPVHPRIQPEHLRDVRNSYRGVPREGRRAAMMNVINGRIREATGKVKDLEKAVARASGTAEDLQRTMFTPEQQGVDLASLQAKLKDAIATRDSWKETRRWAQGKLKNPGSRTTGFLDEAISKQEPYQPHSLPADIAPGPGRQVYQIRPESVAKIEELLGPGYFTSVIKRVVEISNAVAAGAPAATVRGTLKGLRGLSTAEFYDAAGAHSRAIRERFPNNPGPMTAIARQLRDEVGKGLGTNDSRNSAGYKLISLYIDAMEGKHPAEYYAKQFNNAVKELTEEVLPPPSATPKRVRVGDVEMQRGGRSADNVPTKHDIETDFAVADADRVHYEWMFKEDWLERIRENIKRGVAQGAPESEIIQWEHTYTQVENTPLEEIMQFGSVERSVKDPTQILAESLENQRRRVNGEMPLMPVADYFRADDATMWRRLLFGPDAVESSGEAGRLLAAGAEIDDTMFHGLSVENYNTLYGEALFPYSSSEMRAAAKEWLGEDMMNTRISAAEWQQTKAEKLGDFFARGLYPGTWNLRPAGLLYGVREPMRVLQSVNPRLYTRVHDALNAQHFELSRMSEMFAHELQILGVYKEVKGSYVMDPERSARFYQIMNMVPNGEKYELATRALSEAERRSLRRLRQELDFVGDKLGLRNTDKYLEGYIDHVWDKHWSDHGTRMQEIRGLGASTEVRAPIMMEREGNTGYVEDLAMALDQYAKGAVRKLHMEPLFEDMAFAAESHLKQHPGDVWFSDYINHMINNFKGRPSTLGQWVDLNLASLNARMRAHEAAMDVARGVGTVYGKQGDAMGAVGRVVSKLPGKAGRLGGAMEAEGLRMSEFGSQIRYKGLPLYGLGDASRTAMGVTALIYSSVLGGSSRYFPMAVATAMATTGSRMGVFNTLRGILKTATPEGRTLAKAAGLDHQFVQLMEDAAWTKMGRLATNMPTFNGVTVVGPSIAATENMIRSWTFHAYIGDLMRKQGFRKWQDVVDAGLSRAYLSGAVRTTEEVNHLFGQLGKPPMFHRISKSGSVMATQFLSFIPKQMEELMAQSMSNPGRIGQYMMVSGYLQRVAAKVGLDISDYVGMGFLPKSPNDAQSITFETLEAYMASASAMADLADGEGDASAAAHANERLNRALANYIPLAVASQRVTRTAEALRTGGLYTDTGALIYPYDLGGFQWDDSKSVGANLLEASNPRYLGTPEKPSDMTALRTGLSSPQQVSERHQFAAMRSAAQKRIYRREQLADALQVAINKGDTEAFNRQLNLAISEGMIPPNFRSMAMHTAIESALPRLLREETRGLQSMLDGAETLPQAKAMYELQFGTERR